jgi:hypothetical protein
MTTNKQNMAIFLFIESPPSVSILSFIGYSTPMQEKNSRNCNAPLYRGNLPRSGRDAREDLIAATSACP